MYKNKIKRLFDFIASLILIIVFSPILATVYILVIFKLGKPAIFSQTRPGVNAAPFTMYKFRTMTNEKGPDGTLLSNEERMTKFGRLLRKTSLDELPELFNVLKGDMSIVGPRPLRMKYISLYTPFEMRRHEVKPGITGWAQINGRNATTWEDRFKKDVWYVDNISFFLDIKILILTIIKVLKREGTEPENQMFLEPLENIRKK